VGHWNLAEENGAADPDVDATLPATVHDLPAGCNRCSEDEEDSRDADDCAGI